MSDSGLTPSGAQPVPHGPETFGAYIRRLRQTQNRRVGQPDSAVMSQQLLATKVGVSKGYISQIENDRMPPKNSPPRVSEEVLVQMAHALRVSEEEIFNRSRLPPRGFKILKLHGELEHPPGIPPFRDEAEFRASLATFLRTKRYEAGLSHDELCQQSGVSDYDLSQVEQNAYDDLDSRLYGPDAPLIKIVRAVMDPLGFSLYELELACGPCPAPFLPLLNWDQHLSRVVEAYLAAPEELKRVFEATADAVLRQKEPAGGS